MVHSSKKYTALPTKISSLDDAIRIQILIKKSLMIIEFQLTKYRKVKIGLWWIMFIMRSICTVSYCMNQTVNWYSRLHALLTRLFQTVFDENIIFESYRTNHPYLRVATAGYSNRATPIISVNLTVPCYYSHYSITEWFISSEINIYPLLHFALTPFYPYPKSRSCHDQDSKFINLFIY